MNETRRLELAEQLTEDAMDTLSAIEYARTCNRPLNYQEIIKALDKAARDLELAEAVVAVTDKCPECGYRFGKRVPTKGTAPFERFISEPGEVW